MCNARWRGSAIEYDKLILINWVKSKKIINSIINLLLKFESEHFMPGNINGAAVFC